MTIATICPRRVLEYGPWSNEPTPTDHWRDGVSFVNSPLEGPSCSHCGSLSPVPLIAGLVDGSLTLHGSDKSYKWYVHGPNRPDSERAPEVTDYEWTYMRAGASLAKFYTPHLNRPQAEAFLTIWRDKPDAVALYVRPWIPALSDDAPDWLVNLT